MPGENPIDEQNHILSTFCYLVLRSDQDFIVCTLDRDDSDEQSELGKAYPTF